MLQEEREMPYVRLSPEEKSRLTLGYKRLLQEGLCWPRLGGSLLGFEWSQFEPRTFPDHAGDPSFRNPPEFLSLSFTALDAYATAMLAARLKHGDFGEMTFCCELKKEKSDPQMWLELVTITERGRLFPRIAMVELLTSLPQLLQMKKLGSDACYLPGSGCRMLLPYPGKMVAELCPFLRNRPRKQWPAVRLKIRPTGELVARARGMVEFVWDTTPFRGTPN